MFIFLRANSTIFFYFMQTTLRKTCLGRSQTVLAYITETFNENSLYSENFSTQSRERKVSFLLSSLRHRTTSNFEFTWIAKQCFHTLLSCMPTCDQMQCLSTSFEFKKKKVAVSTASRVVSSFVLSLLLSKSQKKSCWLSLENIFVGHLFSIFLSFWSKISNHTTWWSARVQGHTRDKMTQSPPSATLQNPLDLPLSLTCRRSRRSNCAALTTHFFSAMSSPVSSSAFSPPLVSSLARFLSSSTPSFALTLVIGWFLTVSLLLLSHSGASVVAVENRYPCLFFLLLPRLKYQWTKLHTGLAPFQ